MLRYRIVRLLCLVAVSIMLSACGGGGGGGESGGSADTGNNSSDNGQTSPADAPTVTLSFGVKQLQFSWSAVTGATHYRLLENTDGASGYVQVGGDIPSTAITHDINLVQRINARYIVQACNAGGCNDSTPVIPGAQIAQAIGYFKASNTGPADQFGGSVSLSADGNTLAVGAIGESASDDDGEDAVSQSGAVYVFTRSNGAWSQQAYLQASNFGAEDWFGMSLSLSADGNTLAVGAVSEDSDATGINKQGSDVARNSGAVYVFTRSGSTWIQQAYVKASNTGGGDNFGASVSLSADGNTLAVSAVGEASNATGVNPVDGAQDDTAVASGAIYVFTRSGSTWAQQAYVKASNTDAGDWFGISLSLSADGNTLAVGASNEDANIGNQQDLTSNSGAVYVFTRSNGTWSQQAYVKASNTDAGDWFGFSLSLSADGNTLAVGAPNEDSSATGVDGSQENAQENDSDKVDFDAGAVYVFTRSGSTWTQQAYVKASNTGTSDWFGASLAFSADGNTLAVGATGEASNATGIGGDQGSNTATYSGAVYVFTRSSSTWTQQAYVKASNTNAGDSFGKSLSLADGNTLAVGARTESGNATGINNGDQSNNSLVGSGAVYLY